VLLAAVSDLLLFSWLSLVAGTVSDWLLPFWFKFSGAFFPRNGADVFIDVRGKDWASVPDTAVSGKANEGIIASTIKTMITFAYGRTENRNMKRNPSFMGVY